MHKHDRLIKAAGGTTAVGKEFALTPQTVNSWRHNGVPWKYRPRFKELCEVRHIRLPKDFMG